jgi:hypothetical protein
MIESFDPRTIPLFPADSLALSKRLLSIKDQMFSIQLADIVVTMSAKWLMVNIFTWRPLVRRGLPIEQRHTLCDGLVTSVRLAEIETEIYNDVIAQANVQYGLVPPAIDRFILEDLCEIINDLHTMVATQLGEYHLSMSAFELADLLLSPKIAPLTKIDISKEMLIGVTAVEEKINAAGLLMMTALKDRSIPSNIIAPFLELGQLNEKQLAAVTVAIGYRTDASDNMVRYPIMSSYVTGLKDIKEYAIDALMAKKTVYYNKNAMPDSQYNSRKQQILSSVVRHLYPGDCGSKLTIPFYVNKTNARYILDKYIVVDGRKICLTKSNIKSYIGTTVHFKSPLTCGHTDGVCHACGGRLTDYMPPFVSLGIASTIEYMGKVAQLVLSSKHFAFTKAIAYIVPDQLRDFLVVRQNDIYMRETIDIKKLQICIQYRDISHIKELLSDDVGDSAPIIEQQFSTIHTMRFVNADTGLLETPEVLMNGAAAHPVWPYFSLEFLNFLSEHPKNVNIIDDIVLISLKDFDSSNKPLFRYVMQSSSMLKFNSDLAKFATSTIRDFTSIPEALAEFSQMVFSEVKNVNILHLEIVLKSYLIASELDYNIPVVTDINNVKFGTLLSIIPRRSLGGLFAYERLAEFMTKEPELYLFPHRQGDFDAFFIAELQQYL